MSAVETARETLRPTSWKTAAAAAVPAVVVGVGVVAYSPFTFSDVVGWPLAVLATLLSGAYFANEKHPGQALGIGLYVSALLVFVLPVYVFVLPIFTDTQNTDFLVSAVGAVLVGLITTVLSVVLVGIGYLANRHARQD
jgi:hypothetical protein